jgi:hypothetical protein
MKTSRLCLRYHSLWRLALVNGLTAANAGEAETKFFENDCVNVSPALRLGLNGGVI